MPSFTVNNATWNGPEAEFPFVMDFNASVTFIEEMVAIPTTRDVFDVLAAPDYQVYIKDYVWDNNNMTDAFYDVERVVYTAKESQFF